MQSNLETTIPTRPGSSTNITNTEPSTTGVLNGSRGSAERKRSVSPTNETAPKIEQGSADSTQHTSWSVKDRVSEMEPSNFHERATEAFREHFNKQATAARKEFKKCNEQILRKEHRQRQKKETMVQNSTDLKGGTKRVSSTQDDDSTPDTKRMKPE